MLYVSHPLIKENAIESRLYQEAILNTAVNKNTLCTLPTGTGKTAIAILLAVNRLEKYPGSKIIITSPTRPLNAQHQKSFQGCLNMPEEEIILLTGKIRPCDRKCLYKNAKIVVATPQTLKNDVLNGNLNFSDFSLFVIDECQHSVRKYPYPFVAERYMKEAKNPLILGLTASPGSSYEKIQEIRRNIFAEAVEIRTDSDEEVKPYIQTLETEWIKLEFPEELKNAQTNLKTAMKERMAKLKEYKVNVYRKKDLLEAQKTIIRKMQKEKKPFYFYLVSLIAETIKIWYALEMLETQSLKAAKMYFEKMKEKNTKSDNRILKDDNIKNALEILYNYKEEHPKIERLKEIIASEIEKNKNVKIIIFSHFRNNIDNLFEILKEVSGCSPARLVGQAGERGLSQKEQISVLRDFDDGFYNCLITSPIGEEGLSIGSLDIAIFYDNVPSAIRRIQRRGRVARTRPGKLIILTTKRTQDEAYYWKSVKDEKRMKEILKSMKEKTNEKNLNNFL